MSVIPQFAARILAMTRILAITGGTLVLCQAVIALAAEIPFTISEETAQRLAAEALYGAKAKKYLGYFDYDDNLNHPFFEYYGVSKPPAEGGFGYFAVNPWTGDVWALWGCHRLSTPALRKSQAAIRRRFTREELKQYARLRSLMPECVVEN